MKHFVVTFTHVVERKVTALVEASSEEEAIRKAQNGDIIADDEDVAVENSVETKDYSAKLETSDDD